MGVDLRRKATRGRKDPFRLQHSERVHPPLGVASPRRRYRALSPFIGPKVQRRQDDLPQVLRPSSPQGHQLQKEVLRPHLQHQTQEEAEVKSVSFSPRKKKKFLENVSWIS